jgi:hypothetical protein
MPRLPAASVVYIGMVAVRMSQTFDHPHDFKPWQDLGGVRLYGAEIVAFSAEEAIDLYRERVGPGAIGAFGADDKGPVCTPSLAALALKLGSGRPF